MRLKKFYQSSCWLSRRSCHATSVLAALAWLIAIKRSKLSKTIKYRQQQQHQQQHMDKIPQIKTPPPIWQKNSNIKQTSLRVSVYLKILLLRSKWVLQHAKNKCKVSSRGRTASKPVHLLKLYWTAAALPQLHNLQLRRSDCLIRQILEKCK